MQRPVTAVSPDVAVPAPAVGNTPTVPSVPLSTEGIWSVPAAAGSRSSTMISATTCPEACALTVDTVTVPAEAPVTPVVPPATTPTRTRTTGTVPGTSIVRIAEHIWDPVNLTVTLTVPGSIIPHPSTGEPRNVPTAEIPPTPTEATTLPVNIPSITPRSISTADTVPPAQVTLALFHTSITASRTERGHPILPVSTAARQAVQPAVTASMSMQIIL